MAIWIEVSDRLRHFFGSDSVPVNVTAYSDEDDKVAQRLLMLIHLGNIISLFMYLDYWELSS